MKVIVTGCHGKIGGAVCRALAARGDLVHGIDHAPTHDAPFRTTVENLLDPFAFHRALTEARHHDQPVDAVIHLAGHTNARVAPASTVLRENLAINANVFLAAAGAGIPRIVFGSSVQAMLGGNDSGPVERYRRPPGFPIDETTPPRPSNAYGLSKLLTEQSLDHLTSPGMRLAWDDRAPSFTAASLRLPFVLDEQSIQWNLERGGPAAYEWGGAEVYAYVALDDAADALILAASCPAERLDGHEVFLVMAPDPRPLDSVPALVERFYADVPGTAEAIRRDSFVDCSKAATILGWQARTTLRALRSSCDAG